jgi:hypothetical protein
LIFDSSVSAIDYNGSTILAGALRNISTSTIRLVHTYSRVSGARQDIGTPIADAVLGVQPALVWILYKASASLSRHVHVARRRPDRH